MQTNQIQTQQPAPPLDDVLPLDKFQEKHSDKFTMPQLTWILRNRDRNGLKESGAVIILSRKFYLVESRFAGWLIRQSA